MAIFGTPGSTPINTSPFQGTQPGYAPGNALQPVLPGVGMFPPGSNNASGDSTLAANSRAALPANAAASSVTGPTTFQG